jgi:hypothetical protein
VRDPFPGENTAAAGDGIPVPWNGPVFDFSRTFANRDCIDNQPACLPVRGSLVRASHPAAGAQMAEELPLEHPASLDKQAAVPWLDSHASSVLGDLAAGEHGGAVRFSP